MRLTIPKIDLRKEPDKVYPLVEFFWHTLLPLLFLFVGLEYNLLFLVFLPLSIIRIRPNEED